MVTGSESEVEIDCSCGHPPWQHFGDEGYGCIDCPRCWCTGNIGSIPDGWDAYVKQQLIV